jgi:hypothetical protein
MNGPLPSIDPINRPNPDALVQPGADSRTAGTSTKRYKLSTVRTVLTKCSFAVMVYVLSLASGCTFLYSRTLMTKVNCTELRVLDTLTNRELAEKCIISIVTEFGLRRNTNTGGFLALYGNSDGRLVEYATKADYSFGRRGIAELELLAMRLRDPKRDDGVSLYVRSRLSPKSLAMLSDYPGGTNIPLQDALSLEFTRIAGSTNAIYDPDRFANVPLSAATKELLNEKPTSRYYVSKLNRLLLQDAFPQKIRPMEPEKLVVAYELQARRKTKGHLITEAKLIEEMKAKFGEAVEVYSYALWIP